MFRYVVETERRFYLANEVDQNVVEEGGRSRVELDLRDAWVWDMYRQSRFVSSVRVVTFKDVNVEELPATSWSWGDRARSVTDHRRALGARGEALAAAWYEARGYVVVARNWRCRDGELDLVLARGRRRRGLRGEDPLAPIAFGTPAEAVTRTKQPASAGWPCAGSTSRTCARGRSASTWPA